MPTHLWNSEFLLRVSMGLVPGHSYIHKFGWRNNLVNGVKSDIWDFPDEATYTWSTTAPIDTISTNNAVDTNIPIIIQGLDFTTWDLVTQIVTTDATDGRNKVSLGTDLIRVFRMAVSGSTALTGDLYCYEDTALTGGKPTDTTKVRAYINNGNNQTLMGIYTVPNDYTAYAFKINASLSGSVNANVVVETLSRPYGGVFNIGGKFALGGVGDRAPIEFPIPIQIPSRTDLIANATSDTSGPDVEGTFDLLLVKNGFNCLGPCQ